MSQLLERADKTMSKGNEWELACFDPTQNCVERGGDLKYHNFGGVNAGNGVAKSCGRQNTNKKRARSITVGFLSQRSKIDKSCILFHITQ